MPRRSDNAGAIISRRSSLRYSPDHARIAHMERYLDDKGKYDEFQNVYRTLTNTEWKDERDAYEFNRDEVIEALSKTLGQNQETCEKWLDAGESNFSYDTNHRVEHTMSGPGMPTVDISADPITNDCQSIWNLIKQAVHYSYATNMGGGLKDARELLDEHGRPGARGTILLITDGDSNMNDSGDSTSLPNDWDWDQLFRLWRIIHKFCQSPDA